MSERRTECVALRGIETRIRLGVLEAERTGPQTVIVDVEVHRQTMKAPQCLDDCLDYDRLYVEVAKRWPTLAHADLLESWVERLLAFAMEDARVERATVRIAKPGIYPGAALPSVERTRSRDT